MFNNLTPSTSTLLSDATMAERFNELSARERVLISFAAIAFLFMIMEWLFFAPKLSAIRAEAILQTDVEQQQQAMQEVLAGLQQSMAKNHDPANPEQLASLTDVREQIRHYGIVSTVEMPVFFHDLLNLPAGVTLRSLQQLPGNANPHALIPNADESLAFRHRVQMTLQTDYNGLQRYAEFIEHSHWPLYWDELDYHIDHLPVATIRLTLAFFSDQADVGDDMSASGN